MCDTLAIRTRDGMLFAKNSDRPVTEAQVVEWHDRRAGDTGAVAGATALRTQYLSIPDPGAHALLGSRPTWLWGFEHGVNEYRVAIGNEKVWTIDDVRAQPRGLLGMDLVRLGLERATTADDALAVVTALLEAHGQGGSGELDHDEPYFSSFILADASGGWVLETSGRTWAAKPIAAGASISNRLTLSTDWTRSSAAITAGADFQQWRAPNAPTGLADHRLAATAAVVRAGEQATPRDIVAGLRHHGSRAWGAPGSDPADVSPPPTDVGDDWSGVTVCMHVRDYQVTTASIVAELRADDAPLRAWVALGSPCASVYVPVFAPAVAPRLADEREWHRFASLRERVEADADALAEIRAVLAPVEAELWEEADTAFAKGNRASLDDFAHAAYTPVAHALTRLGV